MRVIYGSYTGNATGRQIAHVLGGTLKWLCTQRAGAVGVMRFDLGGNLSFPGTGAGEADLIVSLDVDGFTIGTDSRVNASGVTYHYYGLVDTGDGDIVTGSYTGTATDNRDITSGLGAAAAFTVIRGNVSSADAAMWRSADMAGDLSMRFYAGAPTDGIQSVASNGFQVGTRCNASGVPYYYCSAIAVAGVLSTIAYTGDAVADRAITGAGFAPHLATSGAGSGGSERYVLTASMSAPTALNWNGGTYTNGIKSLISDGLTVGNHAVSNGSGVTYYALCLRDSLVLLTPTTASDTDTGAEAVVDVTLDVGGVSPTTTSAEAVVGITIGIGGVSPTSTGASAALSLLSTTPSAALLDAMARGLHRWLHEVDLPDGSVLRSSSAGYSSLSRGHFAARVLGWGGWEVGISQDGVAAPQTTVDLADVDGALAALLAGEYEDEIEAGCESRILVTAPGLDDWLIAFAGRATGEQSGPGEIRWTIRVDDLALQGVAPRGTWGVGAAWPLAEADARARVAPIVYGEHDGSSAGLGRGQGPTLVLDTVQDIRLVAAGAAVDVVRVWDDDGQVSGSDYTAATTARKGRSWTTIAFSVAPTGTVTVDVQGIEDDGDGGGALLTNAAEQLAHLLSNFYFADASGSSWQATSARIDSASLAAIATWLDGRAYDGAVAHYQGEARSGYDVLREWQESLGVYAWWSGAGQITFGVRPLDGDPYETEHVLRWQSDDLDGRWAPRPERRDVTPGLSVRHQPSASGDYLASLEVRDPEATREGSASLDMPWSAAS